MLIKIRTPHKRRIFIFLLLVIVPAFILWGGVSFFRSFKKSTIVCLLDGKKINSRQFEYYLKMVDVQRLLQTSNRGTLSPEEKQVRALQNMLLLWKAKKDKIEVSDEEVVSTIKNVIFAGRKFDKEAYQRFLQFNSLTARTFEEYIRNFLMLDKLLDKYIKIDIPEEEVQKLWQQDNTKIKLSYLEIPYKNIKIPPPKAQEIKNFYTKHKDLFKEEELLKIKYLLIPEDKIAKSNSSGKVRAFKKRIKHLSLEKIARKYKLSVKETKFISPSHFPAEINNIRIIDAALSLGKLKRTPPIKINNFYCILQKLDEKPARIKSLEDVKGEVKKIIIENKKEEAAEKKAHQILDKIEKEKITDLRSFFLPSEKKSLKEKEVIYRETEYFKYYSPPEELKKIALLSDIVLNLKKGQIYKTPLKSSSGLYIIKLTDLSLPDEKDYQKKKGLYHSQIYYQKYIIQQMKFISQLTKEANLKIPKPQ